MLIYSCGMSTRFARAWLGVPAHDSLVHQDGPAHQDMPAHQNGPAHQDMPAHQNGPAHQDMPARSAWTCHTENGYAKRSTGGDDSYVPNWTRMFGNAISDVPSTIIAPTRNDTSVSVFVFGQSFYLSNSFDQVGVHYTQDP